MPVVAHPAWPDASAAPTVGIWCDPPDRRTLSPMEKRVRRFLLLVAMLLCISVGPALAAPTCQDANGSAARCGAANAMPQGWKLPDDEYRRRQAALGNVADPAALLNAVALIAALLALIALLPDFDGRSDADWDEQEGDKPRRR